MEEVYVIKLKGINSNNTSETSTAAVDTNDIIRSSALGLGVVHVIFGVLVLVFAALCTAPNDEPDVTICGILFGPIFISTGISAILTWRRPFRKLKIKIFFALAIISAVASAIFIALCLLGVAYYHSVPRHFGDSAHITVNAIVAAVGEAITSCLSVICSGSVLWKYFQCGAFKPSEMQRQSSRQKMIVKTKILGSAGADSVSKLGLEEEVIRHVSPHCIISLRATDEQREVIKRVQEYVRDLHSQDEISFTFTDPSTLHDEQDLGLDSQNWRNDVLAVASVKTTE